MTETVDATTGELMPIDPARAAMINRDTDDWMAVYDGNAKNLAVDLCQTDFVPKGLRGNAAATLGVILFGREVGMSPIAAMQGLYAVQGRVGLYAETMRAMVLAAGHEYRIVSQDSSKCVIEGRRNGQEDWSRFQFTMQEARDAGLAGKDVWKSYGPDMLLARATARMCKAIFPDAIRGFSAAEELQDQESPAPVEVTIVSKPEKPAARKRKTAARPSGPEPERAHVGLKPTARQQAQTSAAEPVEAEIIEEPATTSPAAGKDEAEPVLLETPETEAATQYQIRSIVMHMRRLGITERPERLYWAGVCAGRGDQAALDSTSNLTKTEAATALKRLEKIPDRDALEALTN